MIGRPTTVLLYVYMLFAITSKVREKSTGAPNEILSTGPRVRRDATGCCMVLST